MHLIYSLALSILFVVSLPYFLLQAIRTGKYVRSFRQRLGSLPSPVGPAAPRVIWVHAVSVGELNAAKPLIELLRRRLPSHGLVVSTTTDTGQAQARKLLPSPVDAVFYFPFDWGFAVRRALNAVNPEAVVIMETEIWPNFLRECRRAGVHTFIANGRISPRSQRRYLLAKRFVKRVLEDATMLLMQSPEDAERARALGAPDNRVAVTGNLKYDMVESDQAKQLDLSERLDECLRLSGASPLIVAGSTADGEETLLLAALQRIRREPDLAETRLLLAPRHPERFEAIAAVIRQSGFTMLRRSEADPTSNAPRKRTWAHSERGPDVILLDTIGELTAAYRFASVAFIGGSLVPKGGHNVIEAALWSRPIVVGPFTQNFAHMISEFRSEGAILQLGDEGDPVGLLAVEISRLLRDRSAADAMGSKARELLTRNRGAAERTAIHIAGFLQPAEPPSPANMAVSDQVRFS